MGLKRKQMYLGQKARFEQLLKDRMSFLAGRGTGPAKADKDAHVKNLKANIRAVNYRLNQIAADEKRTEEMAKLKAERAAAALKEKEEGRPAEKPRKAPEVVKDKKIKAEKKAAPPKVPEGVQSQTPGGSPEEGKATTQK